MPAFEVWSSEYDTDQTTDKLKYKVKVKSKI